MAIDNAADIKQLNEALPTNQDPIGEGAAQIRALKTTIKNSFPEVDAPVTATSARMNEIFDSKGDIKVGMIVMWGNDPIPEGWAACDGKTYNGYVTHDLTDKFIVAGATAGTTGGANTLKVSEHVTVDEHKIGVSELPPHKHDYTDRYYPENKDQFKDASDKEDMPSNYNNGVGSSGGTDKDNDSWLTYDTETEETGLGEGHTHGLTDTKDLDNRPEFVVLQFIVYVGV